MQIVVDVPEDMYKDAKARNTGHYSMYDFSSVVANGTPLPKGHGRLIDEKDFYENLLKDERATFSKHDIWMMLRPYSGIPTIIREDKGD